MKLPQNVAGLKISVRKNCQLIGVRKKVKFCSKSENYSIPVLEIAASVEKGLKNIRNKPVGEIEMARSRIAQVLHNSRPPTPNVSSQEINALNNLKSDNSIIILKADKGNTSVVLDKDDYESKISQLINDTNTYRKIKMKPNPIIAIEHDVNKFLWRRAKENKMTSPVYSTLKCNKSVSPKFYGLPKVHKVNIPLRPIDSFIGSPTYNLSKFLAKVLPRSSHLITV